MKLLSLLPEKLKYAGTSSATAVLTLLTILVGPVHAQVGVTDTQITLGMVNAQSGPAAGLGTGVEAGAMAYINRVNAEGGVHGRQIVVVDRDDGYEPSRTAQATTELIEKEGVFALFGYVGTPTSSAAVPLASKAGVPYLFPFTGAEFLRNPVNPNVFNVRASYFDETESMVTHLVEDIGASKVAMFMQDDSFGEAVKGGISRALFKRKLRLHAEARFARNSFELDAGITTLKAAQPDAIIFVGTYKQLAAAVSKARAAGLTGKFMTVSFIGTENFISEAGAAGDDVYITQVMPSPTDTSIPLIAQYQADLKDGPIGYTSLEGYVNAMVLVEALRQVGPALSRSALKSTLEKLRFDAGGMTMAFSPGRHQGSSEVFLTRIMDGKAVQVETMQ